ncbi:MAG: hypothetical protein AAFR22_26910, partial [Chloroflexota bacterium]
MGNVLRLDTNLLRHWPVDKHAWHAVLGRKRPPKVYIGALVSASTLFDNSERLSDIFAHQQVKPLKPLGGDMELFQIVTAAQRARVDCICAKAISDFGGLVPKTDDGHDLACATAADFAVWLLGQSVVSDRRGTQKLRTLQDWLGPPPTTHSSVSALDSRFLEGTREWILND